MRFDGKVVAITGAAGGIGQALCRHFGEHGAAIAALDRSERVTEFAETLRRSGKKIASQVVDIAAAPAVEAAFASFAAGLGPIDVLINNAGFSTRPSLERTSPRDWSHDVHGNLDGAYFCAAAVLPNMKARRSGAIVNIGSVNGLSALGDPAYSAAKAGMISLTQALALEYGRFGIRANIICPGTVRTPIWEERMARNPDIMVQLSRWYPLGRVADPIDIARAAAFLASDAAAAITGVVLPVDCGLSAGNIVMARELTLEEF
ncbi:MAG: SDR family oxidoreductase [Methylobacteriaceae bacterium]|nr:SDR family oxidoreductase [Methylobacteriaceae bacterium]MBV9221991.1 SDR family oxidoreductase [Methylobacteriaceae bacterium]MBV9244713.1 SDR family oxidoreductase [Methylobacteriaceae bacterium]